MRPSCVFCNDDSGEAGKLLKCLHKICCDCLLASVQQDGTICCAECQRITPCPPPARSHKQVLIDDSMFDDVLCDEDDTEKVEVSDQNLGRVLAVSSEPIDPESTTPLDARSHSISFLGRKSQAKQHRRNHTCPFHSQMEIRHYCIKCRDVLCDKCKQQHKHTSKGDQIGDIAKEAAAVRHRLTERFRNIIHKTKDYEVDASLQYAEDLLEAFGVDVADQVANVKRLIHESCDDQLRVIKNREQELEGKLEMWRQKQADCQAKFLNEYTESLHKAKVQQNIMEASLRNENLLKLYPHLLQVLGSLMRSSDVQTVSFIKTGMFAYDNLSKLKIRIGAMGKVVDNTDIDLSACLCRDAGFYSTFSGASKPIVALVRNSRDQDVSARELKACGIQIWATQFEANGARTAAVPLPIICYRTGEVHTIFKEESARPTAFFLELQFDPPCPLPEMLNPSYYTDLTKYEPLKTWIFVYPSGASYFDPRYGSPRGFIGALGCFSPQFVATLGTLLTQLKDGFATIQARKPVEDLYSGPITIQIEFCESSKLHIGFTWGCTETSQEMKLVLASSAKERSFPKPAICGCVTGDVIQISRCTSSLDTYVVVKMKGDGSEKKKRIVRVDASNKPILMVRMFDSDTAVWIAQCQSVQVDNTWSR